MRRCARRNLAETRKQGIDLIADFNTLTRPDINFYKSKCQSVAYFRECVAEVKSESDEYEEERAARGL